MEHRSVPQLAPPAAAQLAAPVVQAPVDDVLTAREPETEAEVEEQAEADTEADGEEGEAEQGGGGLGELLSMIIPRSTEQRSHDEIEADLEAEPESEPEPDMPGLPDPLDVPIPEGADAGPILAKKGNASSAPPTDPAALGFDPAAQ